MSAEPVDFATAAELVAALPPLGIERIELRAADGRTLAERIVASSDLVPFARSAMDGFAVRAADTQTAPVTLPIRGEVFAEAGRVHHAPATATAIATGGAIPDGADAVMVDYDTLQSVTDPALAQAYREAPAAKQLHHAWLGGLLEHVVSLCTLADRVVPHYPLLDRDLVLTGVILHDIGKVRELSWEVGFEYTVEGTLLGHIQIGVALAEKTIDSLPNFPPKLKTLVLHMILSHHGKLEFGSPKLPMIPEALVLNFLDDLDAKMQAVQGEFDKCIREGKGPDEMTGKVWALDQRQLLNTRRWLGEDK